MSIFQNSFFSLAGQKERVQNAFASLAVAVNPFSKDKIASNISQPTVKAATEFVANNPYTSAAIIATGGSAAGRNAITSAVSKLSTSTKVAAAVISIPATTALAASERARVATINTVANLTPEKLAKFGNRVGTAIDNPTSANLKDAAFENKTLVAAGAVAAVAAGGTAALGALSTYQNTQAVKANTRAAEATIVNVPKQDAPTVNVTLPPSPISTPPQQSVPIAADSVAATPAAATPLAPAKKKAKKKRKTKKVIKKKKKKARNVRSKSRKKAKKKAKLKRKKAKNAKNRRKKT